MFQKVKQTRIYEELVNQIMESIKRGDLKPRDKLPSEKELAGIFGVSRTTVREALQSLEQYGVIEVQQGSQGGAFIKEMDLDSLIGRIISPLLMANLTLTELTEARAALEYTILTRLLEGRIDDGFLKKLEQNIAQTEEFYRNEKSEERLASNYRFHMILAEQTGNMIVVFLLKIVCELIFAFIEDVVPSVLMIEETFKAHKEITLALSQGDLPRAGEVCFQHILVVGQRIVEKSKRQSLLEITSSGEKERVVC